MQSTKPVSYPVHPSWDALFPVPEILQPPVSALDGIVVPESAKEKTVLGVEYARAGNWAVAVELFELSVQQGGDLSAEVNLGLCCEYGRGCAQDLVRAQQLYRSAAEKGHPASQYCLAICCMTGRGLARPDLNEAYYWYRQAFRDVTELEACEGGLCYIRRQGTKEDIGEYIGLLRIAGMHGERIAVDLGRSWEKLGNFVAAINCFSQACVCQQTEVEGRLYLAKTMRIYNPWNTPAIFALLKCSADAGNSEAQLEVGKNYEMGIGTERNLSKAEEYYDRAAKQGNGEALQALKRVLQRPGRVVENVVSQLPL